MKNWVTYLLIFIVFFLEKTEVSAQTPLFTLSGHIHNAKTDEFLPGATVVLDKTTYFAVTDMYGGYQIKQLPAGVYRFQISMLGYVSKDTVIMVGSTNAHIDFRLQPAIIDLKAVEVIGDVLKTGQKEQSLSVVIADKSFFEKNYGNTFSNTIEKIPGLASINTGTGISKPVIRGFYGNRVIVNDFGVKQEGQQWGTDHGLEIDQFNVEKVAIVKGAASLQYGSDALGGVINLTGNPPPATGKGLSGQITSFFRHNNSQFGSSLGIAGHKYHRFFKARYTGQSFADYRVPANTFIYNGYLLPIYNKQLVNTAGHEQSASFQAGTGGKWGSLQGYAGLFEQKAGFFSGAVGIPRSYLLEPDGNDRNVDLPYQYTRHWKGILNGKWVFKKQSVHTDLGLQHNFRQEFSFPHLHGQGPLPVGNLAHELRLTTLSLNTRYNRYPNERRKVVSGHAIQWQENARNGFEFLLPDYNMFQTGVYSTIEQQISDKMTLNGGLRLDFGHINSQSFIIAVWQNDSTISGFQERAPKVVRNFFNYSSAIGVSWYEHENYQVKVNFGKSFRLPSPPELTQNGVHHGTFRHEQGNADLISENGYQFDLFLMAKNTFLIAEFSPFFNFFKDYIYLRPSGFFSLLPDAGQIYQYTQANAIHTGFEFRIEYHPVEKLHLEANADYVYNLNTETGLPLPFTSPFSVFNQADYTIDKLGNYWSELFFALEHQWTAAQNRTDRNEDKTPGYHLLHIATGVTFKVGKHPLRLTFRIQNLLDKSYMNHLSRFRILNLPEQGRNLMLTLNLPVEIGL